ncbi:LysE family translocator [Lysinibacter cavernae]|uniref:Threonine/homoserine/homoserine lactone efflux protein n=1 Tax=Lysinibacter cavernae TaxID=1640652 RepID=A0A7X5R1B2_9MICO|nr:LysE family translocator [Lysinibacter cavernae]NIH53794.1 threonine/homoserine/homoserine lactone efflux protein [Lysinibacter cavernae]
MNTTMLLTFWGMTVLMVAVPGPDWAYALSAGLRDRRVFPAVGGLMLGYVILTTIVAAGLAAIVSGTPAILTGITLVGACYLMYIGISGLVKPSDFSGHGEERPADAAWWRRTAKGVGVSGLNPKGILIFLALLPQFTDPRADWPFPAQIGMLGLVFIATCGILYTVIGLGARRVVTARPSASRIIARVSSIAMLSIGAFLLAERFGPLLLPS